MTTNSVFRGNLHFISLPDVFQILRSNNKTGELRISSQYAPNAGFIYFHDGSPINSACGDLEGIESIYALGTGLVTMFEKIALRHGYQ